MKEEYFEALKELKIARNHFDNASPEYIDAAILELLMAEAKVGKEKLQWKNLQDKK